MIDIVKVDVAEEKVLFDFFSVPFASTKSPDRITSKKLSQNSAYRTQDDTQPITHTLKKRYSIPRHSDGV